MLINHRLGPLVPGGHFLRNENPMPKLITASQFADADAAYVALIEAHRGLTADASASLNAALVLLLANHVGDPAVLAEAIALAKQTQAE